MRSKIDIFRQLSLLPEPFGTTSKAQVKRAELYLEILIDIRDELHELCQNIGSNLIDLAKEG